MGNSGGESKKKVLTRDVDGIVIDDDVFAANDPDIVAYLLLLKLYTLTSTSITLVLTQLHPNTFAWFFPHVFQKTFIYSTFVFPASPVVDVGPALPPQQR